jgi:hypothetical protein
MIDYNLIRQEVSINFKKFSSFFEISTFILYSELNVSLILIAIYYLLKIK